MSSSAKNTALLLATSLGLVACGGGSDEPSLDTDYSDLRLATSTEGGLQYATKGEQVLAALRNGIRMSLGLAPEIALIDGPAAANGNGPGRYSGTTVQVAGVDEADLVKYDGQHIYALVPKPQPGGLIRNVLKVASTNPANAALQVTSEFALEGERSALPLLYQMRSAGGTTEYVAAVSQNYQGWLQSRLAVDSLVALPDRTVLQLLDVRDPFNVSQAWKIELDGWLRASRKIGDMLYLVSSYRPRLSGLKLPADTVATREANERRILGATAAELLPGYSIDGGAKLPLATIRDCVLPANLSSQDAYADLVVITAVDLNERRVTDVNCISTNVNGVYVSLDSLYVGGEGYAADGAPMTVLHKFGLNRGDIVYRASGTVSGRMGWLNASYFMDEFRGDLRIVTSRSDVHSLSVLRETPDRRLAVMVTLPNAQHPAPIGKPGEQVHAVRFFGERAYVVTARMTDPLYVIDLSRPVDPFIAGELEVPGVSSYLQPIVGPTGSALLLSVGRELNAQAIRAGIKVELFDVSDIARPRSLGAQVFGQLGSSSEATDDPHALTLLPIEATKGYRIALPINVFDTPHDTGYRWTYSGIHLLEIDDVTGATPHLSLAGVIRTDEPASSKPYPGYAVPNRAVLHEQSVFVVNGDTLIGSVWSTFDPAAEFGIEWFRPQSVRL
jgi:hypothetical protein